MKTTSITSGNQNVIITENENRFSARLYVNNGETPTSRTWKGKSMKGAINWAMRVLGMNSLTANQLVTVGA